MLSINKAQLLQNLDLNLDGYSYEEGSKLQATTKNWLGINEDSNSQNQQNLPLKDLVVYVEMVTNGENVSDASYDYLTKLGAKIEKRLTKKCNLVIWKDGALKTVEKAKEFGATVVNSLWLDECCQNFYCAPFDKFLPKLPNEIDLPFMISLENRKKKRSLVESMGSRSSIKEKNSAKKLGAIQKKRKSNPEDVSVNPFVTTFDSFETGYKNEDIKSGSIFDRISLGSPKKTFDSILKKENPQPQYDPKNIIAKYTRSVTFEEKDLLPTTKESSPEDKTHPSKELSDDTISMSEAYYYDDNDEKASPKPTPPKTDVNKILTKYLPSRTLEPPKPSTSFTITQYSESPSKKYTSPRFKINSCDHAQTECSSIEKSPLLTKYLDNNPSTPKKSAFDLLFNRQTSLDSGIKERNPFLPEREEKPLKWGLENKPTVKSVFLRRDQNDEFKIKKNANVNQIETHTFATKKSTTKEKKIIYFVNLSQEGLKLARNFCVRFNFEFVDNMNKLDINKLDYIVYEGAEVPNTYITALAMLKGKPIIKREWMETSLEENSLDDSDIYEHYYNTQSRKKLFLTLKFFIDEEFEKPLFEGEISRGRLVTLIEQAGGNVLVKPKACNFIIIRKGHDTLALNKGYMQTKLRTNEWIIDTIIKGTNVKPNF